MIALNPVHGVDILIPACPIGKKIYVQSFHPPKEEYLKMLNDLEVEYDQKYLFEFYDWEHTI